jgi:hypothetical protein
MASKFEKSVKKMLVSCKQRDAIDKTKRSVFYCLLLKVLVAITDVKESKALRILSMTVADIPEDTAASAQLAMISRLLKVVHSSLLLVVNNANVKQGGITKLVDE